MKSEISYAYARNLSEKWEISYAKCLSDLPLNFNRKKIFAPLIFFEKNSSPPYLFLTKTALPAHENDLVTNCLVVTGMTDFSRYSWTDCLWTTTGRPSVEHHGWSSSKALPNDAKKSVRSCGVIAPSSPILIFLSSIFCSPSRRVFFLQDFLSGNATKTRHTTTQCYRMLTEYVTILHTMFPRLSDPLSVCLFT